MPPAAPVTMQTLPSILPFMRVSQVLLWLAVAPPSIAGPGAPDRPKQRCRRP